jgi:predicted RNA methylase
LYALAAPVEVSAGDIVKVKCSWNLNRLWFAVEGIQPCVPPFAKIHLLDWYSEMMNDLPRNLAYSTAISNAVKHCHSQGSNKPCRVVDIGCGAGLLSMLAHQAGAEEVVGVEITSHLAQCASQVRMANLPSSSTASAQDCVLHADVRSIQRDNEDCFDIALTELLDSSGFGERLIPILRHTKSHLLRSGGDIIPRAIHVYAALADVQLPSIGDIDLSALAPFWLPARASMANGWLWI